MADAEHIEQQDAEQPWQKLPGEKHVWYSRFLTFRDMGPARSVNGAYIIEQQKVATHGKKLNVSPTWYEKSKEYYWHERAQAWDDYRRKEVFTQGYAHDLTRIQKLDGLLELIEKRIADGFKNAKEPKGVNHELIDLYLKAQEAMAKETGGRIQKKELSGPNGAPIEVLHYLPEQERYDELLDADDEDSQEWEK